MPVLLVFSLHFLFLLNLLAAQGLCCTAVPLSEQDFFFVVVVSSFLGSMWKFGLHFGCHFSEEITFNHRLGEWGS